jgi:hypothetical protein
MEQATFTLSRIQSGDRYGRLVAVEKLGAQSSRHAVWLFRCDCGTTKAIRASKVRHAQTRSCGCMRRERIRHGHARNGDASTEYSSWTSMLQRCLNPNNAAYPHYGGRGITVCERWRSFENFLADMGPKPSSAHSLERKKNDKGYEPGNVIWATRFEQNRNKRTTRLVVYQGREMCLEDAAASAGLTESGLRYRLYRGLSLEAPAVPPSGRRRGLVQI